MNILIAGASGFVGQELIRTLKINHRITALGRNKSSLFRDFPSDVACCTWDELSNMEANDFDAVINLSGFNIAASRWSNNVKKKLIDSRVNTSETLINWLIKHKAKPHFFSANAVGIYGLQENGDPTSLDEDTPIDIDSPCDFLSEIGIRWQQVLQPAADFGMQVTTLRFGVVLKKGGGMLKKLMPSFYVGLGSVIGDGRQTISWVHMDDVIGSIIFLLNKPELTGAFNITSPNPVSQEQFARELAAIMHRPLWLKLPAFLIRALFGEMGECLLLKGQRVRPKRLIEEGYQFRYPELVDALQFIVESPW